MVWKAYPSGVYQTCCTIPSNFLNNGWYNIALNLFGHGYTDSKIISELLKIEIIDSPVLRGDYFGGWGGWIHPEPELAYL